MRDKFAGALVTLLDSQSADSATTSVRLQKAIRQMIVEGAVRERDRLPSTRTLSAELRVARDTLEAAYRQLEAEGFLTRRHGSGTFVAKLDRDTLETSRPGSRRKARAQPGPQASLSNRGTAIWGRGGVVDQTTALPFAAAMPDVKPFPLDTWRRLTSRILRGNGQVALMYGDAQGYLPLREEISRYLAAHRGVRCKAEQVIVLNSSQQALSIIASLLLDPGDPVAIEDPGYHGARSVFAAAGVSLHPVPVDGSGLRFQDLLECGKEMRAVYLTPSHHYPTGVTLSLDRRLALIDWAARNERWIIEDDYDSEYRYDGLPVSAIQGLDSNERVLYVGTFSKVLFPSLRLAYLVLPERLTPTFVTARTLIDGQSSMINQMVLAQFMAEGHFTAHIRHMRQIYRARRDAFMVSFARHLAPFADAVPPAGGLHVACKLKPGLSEDVTVQAAQSAGIELPTLRRLYAGPHADEGWLMGFAALTAHEIDDAIRRLSLAISAALARQP
jgi:GntR family transcriptional regulator/MocR family aminotransferase